jgi:O-antigen ligase
MIIDLSVINRERLRLFLIFLIGCTAFSIPFGEFYSQKVLIFLAIGWFFYIKIDELKTVLKNKIVIILFLFLLTHLSTLFWSEHISLGLHLVDQMFRYLLIPTILYISIIKRKKELHFIVGFFVFGMFVNEIISYLIYFNLYHTDFSITRGYPVGFINHIQYSVLVAFSSILILYQVRLLQNKYLKIVYLIFFITMTTNLVISSGRTGYIVYFGSLIILLFTYYKFTVKNFLQVLLFPTIIFYLGYHFNSSVQSRFNATMLDMKHIEEKNYNGSIGARLAFYPIAYDILKQPQNSFILGVGMGDVEEELKQSILRTNFIKQIYPHLHSSYLTAYLSAGLLGLFLLCYLFYNLFSLKIKDKEFHFIQLLFLLNFSIGMVPDILLTQRTTMIYFSFFIAIILSASIIENSTAQKEIN